MNKPDPDITCHHTGHKKKCKDLFMNCPKWIHLQGKHPQTGKDVDDYACADTWTPILMMKTIQTINGVQASTESFRNEMVKGNEKALEMQKQMRLENNESI